MLLVKKSPAERDPFKIPRTAQQSIPVRRIYRDGIWDLGGGLFSRTWRFSDINYFVASKEDKNALLFLWCGVLNSQSPDVNLKITLVNHGMNPEAFRASILLPHQPDGMDRYRGEYNQMLLDQAAGVNGIIQDKYLTVSTRQKSVEEARSLLNRVGGDLTAGMGRLSSGLCVLDNEARLRVLHDFFRPGEEKDFHFDLNDLMKKGHDFKDLICPDSVQFKSNYFELGDHKFGRVIFLKRYASFIQDELISELAGLPKNLMISIDVQALPTETAVRQLQRITMAVDSDLTRWQRRQNENNNFSANPPYDLAQMREITQEYFNELTANDQKMMLVTATLTHLADTLEELNADTAALKAIGENKGCDFAPLTFQQEDGLNQALPYGLRPLENKRTMTTSSVTALTPFSSQEIRDTGGIFYGVNAISQNLIVCNRKALQNGNGFILGVPGSGKSFSAKLEMASVILSTEDDVLIADPENEYHNLVESLGGQVVHISAASDCHINALDMASGYGEGANPIVAKSEFVLSLCDQLMGPGKLGAGQKSLIDRCTDQVFRSYIRDFSGQPPTLMDLHAALLAQSEPEARDIALAIELFTTGSLNVFAHQTNVNMESRVLCFDILDLGKQLKTVGLLVMLDAMLNRVIINRKRGKRTWLYIDEAHLFFANQYSANFLSESWKRFRKYGAQATGITQNLEDCLQSQTARTMLSNSEFLLLLNQSPADRAELGNLLHISETQMNYITNAEAGRGLIKVGAALVPFVNSFPRDTALYRLMNTKPDGN